MMVHEQGDMIGENPSICSSFSALQLPASETSSHLTVYGSASTGFYPLLHVNNVFVMLPADSIEANVESADTNIQKGMQHLSRASEHQVI